MHSSQMKYHYARFADYLESLSPDSPFCIYIDFPFCRSICKYCIYKSIPAGLNDAIISEYRQALVSELHACRDLFSKHRVESIYFGGGTPSLWGIEGFREIADAIPEFDSIRMKKTELHPGDLTQPLIEFLSNTMRFDVVSIGVQSFSKEACDGQGRRWCSAHQLRDIVSLFRSYDVKVNIDLVALFNGDSEIDWEVYKNDVLTACSIVSPDVITSIPNYRTGLDYLEQIPRFRKIFGLAENYGYLPRNDRMLSQDLEEIERYGLNDHWMAKPDYWDFERGQFRYSCSGPKHGIPNNQTTLSFGGLGKHMVYSYFKDGSYVAYTSYSPQDKSFILRDADET